MSEALNGIESQLEEIRRLLSDQAKWQLDPPFADNTESLLSEISEKLGDVTEKLGDVADKIDHPSYADNSSDRVGDEVEETRAVLYQTKAAVQALTLPLWIMALGVAYLAYETWVRTH
jgi:hypothetical protein